MQKATRMWHLHTGPHTLVLSQVFTNPFNQVRILSLSLFLCVTLTYLKLMCLDVIPYLLQGLGARSFGDLEHIRERRRELANRHFPDHGGLHNLRLILLHLLLLQGGGDGRRDRWKGWRRFGGLGAGSGCRGFSSKVQDARSHGVCLLRAGLHWLSLSLSPLFLVSCFSATALILLALFFLCCVCLQKTQPKFFPPLAWLLPCTCTFI